MSVFLVFMGLDIISHTAEHLLEGFQSFAEVEGVEGAEPHDHHSHHARVSPGSIDLAALLAIISTLISAVLLKNHERIGKAMRITTLSWLPLPPQLINNPSHFLTLTFSTLLLLLPLLSVTYYSWLDRFLALAIAISMLGMGTRLIKSLGSMLLMSMYTEHPDAVGELVREIEQDPSGVVKRVTEAKVWQVHYGLGMANLRVVLAGQGAGQGAGEGDCRVRERIVRIVKDRLGEGGVGRNVVRWEVSVAFCRD
ncbi:cation efflux protein [Kalaharituber pfeilii]|nr:cation efflux protein [Kalaharituber pfeilii]